MKSKASVYLNLTFELRWWSSQASVSLDWTLRVVLVERSQASVSLDWTFRVTGCENLERERLAESSLVERSRHLKIFEGVVDFFS